MSAVTYRRMTQRRERPRRMRNTDWALLAGAVFFGALLLLAVYGPLLAPHDLYYSRALLDGKAPPFAPSAEYPFGSDSLGRDRWSWLLIGARGSVVIALGAAALRVLLGGSLGLVAGFKGGALAEILRRLALGLSSVPATIATLLAVIALGLDLGQFILAFGLTGWAEPFHQARRHARSESARPFMESARSLGLSDRRLLFRHLLPNVAPQLLTTAAFQVSAVLLLTAELALLSIFIGGAVFVDYDSRGLPIYAPKIPNWASMLAATRPIVSLYGDLASVFLPGAVLLGAVLATNVFGDALAARAQRLDVFRLFSRRQAVALLGIASVIAFSVTAWPSRLADEIRYADGFDAGRARALAGELAALGPRPNGSPEARSAADLLSQRLSGTIVTGTDQTARAKVAELAFAGASLNAEAVSLDSADLRGPLFYVDVQSLLRGRAPDALAGAIVVVDAVVPSGLQRLAAAEVRGVIVLQSVNLTSLAGVYPIPVIATTRTALGATLGRALPDLRASPDRYQLLASDAHLRIEVEQVEATIVDVIGRFGDPSPDAPVVILAARYDAGPGASSIWDTASAASMLAAVADHVRAHPLPLRVIALASSADHQSYAGLRLALAQLTSSERDRVQAIILLGPVLSDSVVLETQPVPGLPSGTGRLAARLEDAFGARLSPQPAGDLIRAIVSKVAALPLGISAPGVDQQPSDEILRHSATVVLTALAYIPTHQSEMR